MKTRNYEIGRQGVDSISEPSHPASDRISDYNDTLYNRTGDIYSHNDCGCEIDPADREKRIEELDELIHDKIGDTDKHMKSKNKEQYHIYNAGKNADKDIAYTTNQGIKSESFNTDKNNSDQSVNNSSDRYSSFDDATSDDIAGCGCGVGYMDDQADNDISSRSSNRIDDNGDDWIVERIDVWVDDSADDQTDTGSVYDNQIGDNDRSHQKKESHHSHKSDVNSKKDGGMHC